MAVLARPIRTPSPSRLFGACSTGPGPKDLGESWTETYPYSRRI